MADDILDNLMMKAVLVIMACTIAILGFAACTGRLGNVSLCAKDERYDMGVPVFQTIMYGKVPVQQVSYPFAKCVKVEP